MTSAGSDDRLARGALLDLVAVTIALAQQDGGWRVAVGDVFDVYELE
jgi:hypothetical protein